MISDFSLDHIIRMTDDVGIFEHCKLTTVDKAKGYSVDDNARLKPHVKKKRVLINTYLKFIVSAVNDRGFYNDLNSKLKWENPGGRGEWFGRAMEALSESLIFAPNDLKKVAISAFEKQLPLIKKPLHLRTTAHLITALSNRVKDKDTSQTEKAYFKTEIIRLANLLVRSYKKNEDSLWRWFEQTLTYDNARLPLSLFLAYEATGTKKFLQIAEGSLNFLIKKTYDNKRGCFSFPGNKGWFPKDGEKALFGQQPIEAGSMVEVCSCAYKLTGKKKYLKYAIQAFEWYKGRNISKISLIDKKSGGIKDGLESWGVNPNEGSESILGYAIACLSLKKIGL